MMYYVNKIVMAFLDPLAMGLLLTTTGFVLVALRWRRTGWVVGGLGLLGLWVMGCGVTMEALGCHLEGRYPAVPVATLPQADAIVLLGGGMSACPSALPYPEMHAAADRVWHAARLFKAGKAPLVMPSGMGEEDAAVPLLVDLGVPKDAIRTENAARNTEENAKFVQDLLVKRAAGKDGKGEATGRPRVLLVTSAWHMRRALLMYRRYAPGLEIVPAACDYEATISHAWPGYGNLPKINPGSSNLSWSCYYLKEIIGYWGYRLLRR